MSDIVKSASGVGVTRAQEDAKNLVKGYKTQHALHVLLIMETLGVSKSQAETVAWAEGMLGYSKRMAEK